MVDKDGLNPSFPEIMGELYRLFGTRRMVELLGFALLAGATLSETDTALDVRDKLMGMGFSRAAVYRFTGDMKELVKSLEERGRSIPMSELLREINSGDTSLMGDFVVK
jgi:hypothetical protein